MGLRARNPFLKRGCEAGIIADVAEDAVASLASESWWPRVYRDERVLVWLDAGSESTFRGLPRRRTFFPFLVVNR